MKALKHILAIATLLTATVGAQAQKFTEDGVTYNILSKEGNRWTCEITSGGTYEGDFVIPAGIFHNQRSYLVTGIGSGAFRDCANLRSVSIPTSITSIGSEAFAGCTALDSVSVPYTVTRIGWNAFPCLKTLELQGNEKAGLLTILKHYNDLPQLEQLEKLYLGRNVTEYGFTDMPALQELHITSHVDTLREEYFARCPELRLTDIQNYYTPLIVGPFCFKDSPIDSLYFGRQAELLGNSGHPWFNRLKSLQAGYYMKHIPNSFFSSAENLENAHIADVSSIGEYAFSGCGMLKSVDLHYASSIGSNAFARCVSLHNVALSEQLTEIKSYTFDGCTALEEITIPASVNKIETMAFKGCTNLRTLRLADGETPLDLSFITEGGIPVTSLYLGRTFEELPGDLFKTLADVSFGKYFKEIPERLFADNHHLKTITLPGSLTTIQRGAFAGCDSLTTVTSVRDESGFGLEDIYYNAFDGCTALTQVNLTDAIKRVLDYAFRGCTALEAIHFPGYDLQGINQSAFEGCTALTSLTFDPSTTLDFINDNAFRGCTALRSLNVNVKYVGQFAFRDCTALTEINLGESPETIELGAFRGCTALTEVVIPRNLTTLGSNAFASCTSLRKVTFNGYVDETLTLGYEPFIFCPLEELVIYRNLDYFDVPFYEHKITSVEFGEGVTTIPHQLLEHCETLTNVKLPSTLTTIGEAAFKNCTGLTDISLPFQVASIGKEAFSGCTGLTEILTPRSLTEMEEGAFEGCSNAHRITVNGSLPTIPYEAFSGCASAVEVILPESIRIIEERAFENCEALHTVTSTNPNPPLTYESAFPNRADNIVLYVPVGAVDAYRSTIVWEDFFRILEIGTPIGIADDTRLPGGLSLSTDGGMLRIDGLPEGTPAEVYTANGALLYQGTATSVALPGRGLYIVRAAGQTKKIAF